MTPITWYLYGRSGGAKKAAEEIGVKGSVSGDIAVISDGADDVAVKSLVAEITPVQSGSGDPSPTNIRPISGRTGLTVTRCGKNLLSNSVTSSTISNVTFTVNDDRSITVTTNGTASARANLFYSGKLYLPASNYYLSIGKTFASGQCYFEVAIHRASTGTNVYANTNARSGIAFTLSEGDYIREMYFSVFSGQTVNDTIYPQIEVGSSATDYETSQGTTLTVDWTSEAGTVYGGTLDVVSGVLTVDRGYYTITDADIPVLFQTGGNANRVGVVVNGGALSPTVADRLNIMSNIAKADVSILTQSQQAVGKCCLYSAGSDTATKALFGVPITEDTAAKAKAWLIAQGCAFVYPLATPQTYQLTPTEVRTILGGNTIYTDAGAVSVEYVADTKLYIDNKVAELQALILEN